MPTIVLLASLLFISGSAHATTISVTYSGTIQATFGSGNPVPGETFSGVYTYDDSTPDHDPGNPLHGDYDSAVLSHTVSFSGGRVRVADIPSAVELYLDVGGFDRYRVNGVLNAVGVWAIDLFDSSRTALATDALVPPVLGSFDNPTFFFSEGLGSSEGTLTSLIVAVPQPTSALLLGAGLAALAGRRQRLRV